jgi:Ser/Thr protein kinase RdoA (MazF antagonist)
MLLSFCPGQPVELPVSPRLVYEMGALLARLHEHPAQRFGDASEPGESNEEPGYWWTLLSDRFGAWEPQCRNVLPAELCEAAVARYAALAHELPSPDGPRWVHFDYRLGNILAEGADGEGQITALIDFESSRGGSADLDFVKISHRLWDVAPATRAPFLDGYAQIRPLPPIERTLRLYRLHNAFGGIAWCVRRSSVDDPFFAENLQVLQDELRQPTRYIW